MHDRRLLVNSFANLCARAAAAVLNVTAVPLFIKELGQEAYGLVAFVVSLQALLTLLDFGLAATANREVARAEGEAERLAIAYTLTRLYWWSTLLVGACLIAASYPLARYWVNLQHLSVRTVTIALILAGISMAIRWPVAVYIGILQGLERQTASSIVSVACALFRIGGGLVVIALVPSIIALFAWYTMAAVVEVTSMALVTRSVLRVSSIISQMDLGLIKRVWRFAVGFSIVSAAGTLLSNLDRLLLAKYLPLRAFAVYAAAATIAALLAVAGNAICSAAFPRLARATTRVDTNMEARRQLSATSELVLWAVIPISMFLILFCNPLLDVWARKSSIVAHGGIILVLLAVASCVNAMANPLYSTLVAKGETKWLFTVNLAGIAIFVPFYMIFLPKGGAVIAAVGVIGQNAVSLGLHAWKCRAIISPVASRPLHLVFPVYAGVLLYSASRLSIHFDSPLEKLLTGACALVCSSAWGVGVTAFRNRRARSLRVVHL